MVYNAGMRLATPPPREPSILADLPAWIDRQEWIDFVRKANTEYYHWEDLRHRPLPLGITPAQAWHALSFYRANRTLLPLVDIKGRPFSYWLPEHAHQVLHTVDRQGGGTLALPDELASGITDMRDRVLIDSLMEEAIATSQIEGAVTTRKVAKELLRTGRKPRDRSERMIVNGYRTVQLLRERANHPLSVGLLHGIQESMTRDTLDDPSHAGRFRSEKDDVCIVDSRDNEIVFVPPPADQLPQRIERLIAFANADPANDPFIHPLVRAAILHFWFAYEHPYVDGNGRTARALFYWFMLKHGYWLFEFLTISRMIHAAPIRYYRSFLYSEQDNNDLTYFLMFQLGVTERSLDELHGRLREMQDQEARMRAVRQAARLNSRQRAVLDHALRHPRQIYTFESHMRSHGITYQTARTDILGLLKRAFLIEVGAGRTKEFLPHQHLARKLGLTARQ